MKTIDEIRRDNLSLAVLRLGSATALATKAGVSTAYLSQIKHQTPDSKTGKPKAMGDDVARKVELALEEPLGWMDQLNLASTMVSLLDAEQRQATTTTKRRAADYELLSADDARAEVGEIEYWEARGSCGGGFLNHEQLPKGHLVKEATFFHKYRVKPKDLFAIYADGDSMSDFIIDGDIVIFDRSRTTPRSGKIYAVEHPDGLKIKLLRRGIDGAWYLESKNIDKRTYPDERIEPEHAEMLKVLGEFVYRQGG